MQKRLLESLEYDCRTFVLDSFSDANDLQALYSPDLILVDDVINGTSSYELISFLRLNQQVLAPILYFDVAAYDGEKKALSIGASHFFQKPFHPDEVSLAMKDTLTKSKLQL